MRDILIALGLYFGLVVFLFRFVKGPSVITQRIERAERLRLKAIKRRRRRS